MQLLKPIFLLPLMIFSPITLAQEAFDKVITATCKTAIVTFADNDLDRQLCLFHPKVFNNVQASIEDPAKMNTLLDTAQAVCPADLTTRGFDDLASEHLQWELRQIPPNERPTHPEVIESCNKRHP